MPQNSTALTARSVARILLEAAATVLEHEGLLCPFDHTRMEFDVVHQKATHNPKGA